MIKQVCGASCLVLLVLWLFFAVATVAGYLGSGLTYLSQEFSLEPPSAELLEATQADETGSQETEEECSCLCYEKTEAIRAWQAQHLRVM